MEKQRLSKILSRAAADEVSALAGWVREQHEITVIKEPAKTLVMMPMIEPVSGAPFFLGELLACDAMVEIDGARGAGIAMGDDFDKVLAMAIIDAAYNARLEECQWLTGRLATMEQQQQERTRKEAALHAKTKVSFRTMEGA